MPTETLPRPAERVAIFSLLLVFLCGIALGAVAMSYWHPWIHSRAASTTGLAISTREYKEALSLTDDQTRQLTSILDDFSRYYDNLLADGNSRILQILTPDQRRKYDEMMKAHRR